MKNIKKYLVLALILSLLIITGCINYSIETTINSDGSGSRAIDLAIDNSFAQMMETAPTGSESVDIESEMKKALPKGGKYKKFEKDDKTHYNISFDFKNIDDLVKKDKKFAGTDEGLSFKNTKLEKKDYLVVATYKFSEEITSSDSKAASPESEQLAQSFALQYKLKMPGKINKAEKSDSIKDDTATWKLSFIEGGKISATSQLIRWWVVIAIAVVLLLAFLIIIILIFMAVRSKKKKKSAEVIPEDA